MAYWSYGSHIALPHIDTHLPDHIRGIDPVDHIWGIFPIGKASVASSSSLYCLWEARIVRSCHPVIKYVDWQAPWFSKDSTNQRWPPQQITFLGPLPTFLKIQFNFLGSFANRHTERHRLSHNLFGGGNNIKKRQNLPSWQIYFVRAWHVSLSLSPSLSPSLSLYSRTFLTQPPVAVNVRAVVRRVAHGSAYRVRLSPPFHRVSSWNV